MMNLIGGMLDKDPTKRPTLEEVRKNLSLNDLDLDSKLKK
jgi:hypothetical protein